MNPTMTKDKICLDLTEFPDVAELLSRKQPGDTVSFKGTGTVDEAKDGMAVLSIETVSFTGDKPKADKSKSMAAKVIADEAEAGDTPADEASEGDEPANG